MTLHGCGMGGMWDCDLVVQPHTLQSHSSYALLVILDGHCVHSRISTLLAQVQPRGEWNTSYDLVFT